ncbi:hypothetical protein APHAL10511_000050 [Amanita phalloides]|nr:hypothetical protein APHAL10511_000050 [Amanita phalloides]
MFYSETILSRRGPLAKVWLAAHMERKLSKTQTLQTNIEQSVDAIMGQEIEVMALRLSGQLLLGVVRIYSRKAKYLLDDCNEALLKIKMAFRPGLVDMTDEQLVVSKNAITLPSTMVDLDLLLPDVNWDLDFERRPQHPIGSHQAHVDDITLRAMDNIQHLDTDLFDLTIPGGLGSQDFQDIDLDIGWDEHYHESKDDMSSLGIGRDVSIRASVDSYIEGLAKKSASLISRSPGHSSTDFQDNGVALNAEFPAFEGVNLGDFGVGFDRQNAQQDIEPSRASSPLTELPQTPPNTAFDISPLTVEDRKSSAWRTTKGKKQIVDSVTELQDNFESNYPHLDDGLDMTGTKSEQQFLRKSPVVLRLLEIHNNPIVHLFYGKNKQHNIFHCAAPSGLEPELMQLYMRPTGRIMATKRKFSPFGRLSSKRVRSEIIGDIPDVELEYGRKNASPTASVRLGSDMLGRNVDFDGGQAVEEDRIIQFNDQINIELDNPELDLDAPSYEVSKSPQGLERTLNVDGIDTLADDTCHIAVFDSGPLRHSQDQDPEANTGSGNFSKNTSRAMAIIQKELASSSSDGSTQALSFQSLSNKATRRATASFFFELLVLGTRDCLKLSQTASFDDINILPKEKLWSQSYLSQTV